MNSHEFDIVKAEKANAIARYRRFRYISKFFQIIEVFLALTLVSWLWTRLPTAMKIVADYFFEFSVYLLNPHVVFLIGNAIVIALYVLSRRIDAGNVSGTTDYDEYVENSQRNHRIASAFAGEIPPSPAVDEPRKEDKQIACSENAVSELPCEAAATSIEEATKQIRRFQRTQSEKLKCEISVKPRRELRRSESETRQIVVASEYRRTMTSYETVESLSNEEFRLTIEAFIAKQQSLLRAQKMAENEP